MSEKVKRGLGMLAVALVGALVYLVMRPADGDMTDGAGEIAGLIALGAIICGGYGLVLVAWGLLRD